MLIYTSGTTGPPKGAMISHGAIMAALASLNNVGVRESDVGFAFLPLGHVLQRIVSYTGILVGIPGVYARALDTAADDFASARPTVVAAVPRVFEKIYAKVLSAAAAHPTRKKLLAWALRVGTTCVARRRAGLRLSPRQVVELAIARKLVFSKLRARLGGRIRLFVTGGAPIAREILEFFEAADITILEAWGMTETCAAGTMNLPGKTRPGTIGPAQPGVELELAEDGELLIRGGCMFKGYYKDAAATAASHTADGYFMTGDLGKRDSDGYFSIVDRKKDLVITAAGKNVAPQNIENLMKTDPRLSQVVVLGDRKPYLVALVTLTAEARAGKSDQALEREVAEIFAAKNPELASYERIKRFAILPEDLSIEAGELTPTLKVRRQAVSARHAARIEALYAARS
jgi:long-chain acyl-CoA synthetase